MPTSNTPATDRIWVVRLPLPSRTFTPRELRGIAISIAALGLVSIEQYGVGERFTITRAQAKRVEPLFKYGFVKAVAGVVRENTNAASVQDAALENKNLTV